MHIVRWSFVGLAAAASLACESPADIATAPQLGAASPVTRAVTGSGHVPSGEGIREFTFHAQIRADGSAQGSYKIAFTATGLFLEVDVTCATIVGDTAWVAGRIVASNIPVVRVGTVSYFYAIDNGEGDGTPPDRVSVARLNDVDGEDTLFCTTRPLLLPSFEITDGNVQVR